MTWNLASIDDAELASLAREWTFPADSIYLNHGSFGPPPREVRIARRDWIDRLDDQPMQFYVRDLEPAWLAARRRLAEFVNAREQDLAFVENATYGMNVVAESVRLQAGDEVLLNAQEYGAVRRIWERACARYGAQIVDAPFELPVRSHDAIADAILDRITSRTRLIIVSHITSAGAVTMPVERIVAEAHARGVAVCIDGPHAIAQLPVDLESLAADYYVASLHKWLSAPLGSGFVHVREEHHASVRPPLLSWGRLLPALPERWDEQFRWTGTRDPSPYLTVPTAIGFLERFGLERFRDVTFEMARRVRRELESLLGQPAIVPDDRAYYGCMTEVLLPEGDWSGLQDRLRREEGIEVPIVRLDERWAVRVSCHLYVRRAHIDRLMQGLERLVVRTATGRA